MDLAEIRKKAKSKESAKTARESRTGREGKEDRSTPGEETAPAAEMPGGNGSGEQRSAVQQKPDSVNNSETHETAVTATSAPPMKNAMDALEALFRQPDEGEVLAAENDLQFLHKQDTGQEMDLRQMLAFSLGSEEYALDIEYIREIIKPREIADIPRVPGFILGIISLRGIIIPVFDLKQRLKLGRGEIEPSSRIVVCQQGEKVVGLLVDGISQVFRITDKSIEPPPAVLSGLDRDMVEGVGRYQGRMTILLRLSCIMDAELI